MAFLDIPMLASTTSGLSWAATASRRAQICKRVGAIRNVRFQLLKKGSERGNWEPGSILAPESQPGTVPSAKGAASVGQEGAPEKVDKNL